jgi:hypothetical protein
MDHFLPKDTTLEAARVQFEALRCLGVEGRAQMTFELCDTVRTVARDGIRQRHPDYTEQMVQMAFLRLVLGDRVFKQVYPDAADIRP